MSRLISCHGCGWEHVNTVTCDAARELRRALWPLDVLAAIIGASVFLSALYATEGLALVMLRVLP
jgi:hypothetical protein